MSEKKLRKRAEEAELKENGLRETAPDECVPEVSVPEEHVPEERAAEDFVQEELQIRLPGRTLDAHALVRERVAHILSLGNEPSPSPYNAARLPGFLTSCLNPVYLEELNQQEQPGENLQGERLEPAAGTASSGSDPVPLLNPAPLFNPALSAEQVEAACREYIRCCTAQLMRYAEPADELVVESLTTLGAPLTLHYLLTGHIPDAHTWEHGEPDTQLSDYLHSVGAPAEGESALFCSANGYYTPGEHQMSRDKFGKALATRRLRWNRRMERTLNAEAHMAATCGAWRGHSRRSAVAAAAERFGACSTVRAVVPRRIRGTCWMWPLPRAWRWSVRVTRASTVRRRRPTLPLSWRAAGTR